MKALRILYIAILSGTLIFAAVIYIISQEITPAPLEELQSNILLISLFVSVICLSVSSFFWRKDIAAIQQGNESLNNKFSSYRTASIKRYAFTEAAALFSIVCYFLTHETRLMVVVALLVGHYLTLFPAASKIASQIGSDAADIENL